MRKPDFFIVGAPKSGTTALSTYLKAHPDVFMPTRKELGFFGSDLTYTRLFLRDPDVDRYLAHFAGRRNEARAGEASVWYLYSKNAAREIRDFSFRARILIMLRNPVDVLYASYHELLYSGGEELPTFEEALAAEEDRRRGRRIPPQARLLEALFYRDTVRFAEQVRRYLDLFGRQRVHLIRFDDFAADTAGAYRGVLEFLEVEPSFRPPLRVVNPNKQVRSRTLSHLYTSAPLRAAAWRLPGLAQRTYRLLRALNTRYVPRPPMSPQTRRALCRELRPEVEALGRLLGWDLSAWSREGEP